VDEDGTLGPKTIQATNEASPRDLLLELACVAGTYYRTLVELKPNLARFHKGWRKRAAWPWGNDEYVTLTTTGSHST
jgi:lysozyme family protein